MNTTIQTATAQFELIHATGEVEHFDTLAAACQAKLLSNEDGHKTDLRDEHGVKLTLVRCRAIVADSLEPAILTAEETGIRLGSVRIPDRHAKLGWSAYRYGTIAPGHVRLYKLSVDCKSETGDVYDVTPVSCDCPDAEFHGHEEGHTCKHVAALVGLGLLVDPADAPEDDREPEPTPELVAEELLHAEAKDGASMAVMLGNVRKNFAPAFSDRVVEIITKKREQERIEAELDRQFGEAMSHPDDIDGPDDLDFDDDDDSDLDLDDDDSDPWPEEGRSIFTTVDGCPGAAVEVVPTFAGVLLRVRADHLNFRFALSRDQIAQLGAIAAEVDSPVALA